MTKIISESLHLKVEQALLEIIKESNNSKLKSEEELSKILGVSRTTIREAMNSLLKKGILTKRHGKGNFVHKSAIETKMRIDIYHSFMDLIRDGGYEPSLVKISDFKFQSPSNKIQAKLKIDKNELVASFFWMYKANNISAIYVDIQVPKSLLKFIPDDDEKMEDTFRFFLNKYCNQDLAHCISKIKAIQNKEIAKDFGIDINTPLIMWEELFYNIYDEIIAYNEIYFNPEIIDMSLLIKI